jgi:hypothetical protein
VSSEAVLEPIAFGVRFQDNLQAIWYDSFIVPLTEAEAELGLSRIEVLEDENGDGFVNPSETASVQIFAKNIGTGVARDIWAQLETADPWTTVKSCRVGVGSQWTECDANCSCADAPSSTYQDLEAGEHGTVAVLVITFDVNPSAPLNPLSFAVSFHDKLGNSWPGDFTLPVFPADAEVTIGNAALLDDSNGDGFLSPAESASMVIYPRNDGTVTALGVWAKLVAVEPGVNITGCFTEADGGWINCGVGCNCDGVFESALQDLEGEQTSERPMLRIDFETASTVALGSLSFGVAFTDSLGLTWTDLILLDVVSPDTHVQIGIAEMISDSGGDGALNAGDTATVNVFAENVGTTTALGVWARLTNAAPGLDITSCYALNEEKWATCDVACSCQSIPESIKTDIPEGETSDAVVLQVTFNVPLTTAPGPQSFTVELTDSFDNVWEDSFSIQLVE